MKKATGLSIIILLIAIGGHLYGDAFPQIDALERMYNRGKIVFVASVEDHYPFLYKEGGAWQGSEVGCFTDLAKDLGLPWEVLICKDDEACMAELNEGRGDILAGGRKQHLPSAQFLVFSEPILRGKFFVLYDRLRLAQLKRDQASLDPEGMLAINDYELGIIDDSSSRSYLRRVYQRDNIRSFKNGKAAIDSLRSGEIQLCLLDEWEYWNYFRSEPRSALLIGAIPIPAYDTYCFSVLWKNARMVDLINLSLSKSAPKGVDENLVRRTYYSWR